MAKLPLDQLPNRIRALRKAREWALSDLAPKANLSVAHLSKLEVGERELSDPVMKRLAHALGVPPADLLTAADGGLTDHERELIRTYREIPSAGRAAIDAVAASQQPFRGQPGEVVAFRAV